MKKKSLPDSKIFVHAGTNGVRHAFPVRLVDAKENFVRSISRLRSQTTSNENSSNLQIIRYVCSTIPTVEHFDLSANELDDLPVDLTKLVDLKVLNCSKNRISQISSSFEKLKQIKEFDFSQNCFKRFPSVFYNFENLERLNGEQNQIKMLDEQISNLKFLKVLILDKNLLENIDFVDFGTLPHLESIHLSYNQLNKFPRNLDKLKRIKIVDLSFNKIQSFPVDLLLVSSLDVLNLSHNQLQALPSMSDAYKRTNPMFSIDFSHNKINRFYAYLLFVTKKLDLSNNCIDSIGAAAFEKFTSQMLRERELRLNNNPIFQSNKTLIESNSVNFLPFLNQLFRENDSAPTARQGFQISILGNKNSGKTALAYCLEENLRWPINCENQTKQERIVNIHHCSFEIERKEKKDVFGESRSIPLSIYDFNGSSEYFDYFHPFINPKSLFFFCFHSIEFDEATKFGVEKLFDRPTKSTEEMFDLLQLIFDRATPTQPIVLVPLLTFIDLYDSRAKNNRVELSIKVDRFFEIYLERRSQKIRSEIAQIESLPKICGSLSERLKTFLGFSRTKIDVKKSRTICCSTFDGIQSLEETIAQIVLNDKIAFAEVDRIFPSLWVETFRSIEKFSNESSLPIFSWKQFVSNFSANSSFSDFVEQITRSLENQGKILIFRDSSTNERFLCLRPICLSDLISSIFCSKLSAENQFDEFRDQGLLHKDLLEKFVSSTIDDNEKTLEIFSLIMRFAFVAYPKINSKQIRSVLGGNEIKFDYSIVPSYLSIIDQSQLEKQIELFERTSINSVSVCYRSTRFARAFFHRYTVSALFHLPIIYLKHYNDLLFGCHEERQVYFLFRTDHRTFIECCCGTSINEQTFDEIWHVLILLINHLDLFFQTFAPNNQFDRLIRCPKCHQYSFMAEWMTPKDMQNTETKQCLSCQQHIETFYLIQPNETKRRNREILRRIRANK